MYKQIDLDKNDLLAHFLRSMSTNKVASKSRAFLIPLYSKNIHNLNEKRVSSDANFINSNHIQYYFSGLLSN